MRSKSGLRVELLEEVSPLSCECCRLYFLIKACGQPATDLDRRDRRAHGSLSEGSQNHGKKPVWKEFSQLTSRVRGGEPRIAPIHGSKDFSFLGLNRNLKLDSIQSFIHLERLYCPAPEVQLRVGSRFLGNNILAINLGTLTSPHSCISKLYNKDSSSDLTSCVALSFPSLVGPRPLSISFVACGLLRGWLQMMSGRAELARKSRLVRRV